MVLGVTRGRGVVGGHRDARLASHGPVAVDVPPELVIRLDAGHTVAVLPGAGGVRTPRWNVWPKSLDSESWNREMKPVSPVLPWYV